LEQIQETLNYLISGPYPWVAAVVLLCLFILWSAARREPVSIVAFDSPNGEIRVARTAINELVQRTGDMMPTVGKCSTRVHTRGDVLNIEVRIKLLVGSRLSDVSTELQERLSSTLRDSLGIERLGGIDVEVVGLTGKIEDEYLPVAAPTSNREVPEDDLDQPEKPD